MSITFHSDNHKCDCGNRWMMDCEPFGDDVADWPEPYYCHVCTELEMNLANENAYDLMRWLDLTADCYGETRATELAARCRRRLWDEARNHDTGREAYEEKVVNGPRFVVMGRMPGYLREKTEKLLKIAEAAGEGMVLWD